MSPSKITGFLIFTFVLFHLCSSHANENNFEYSVNNITEDFMNVAIAPKTWEYRFWSWIGTDKVNVRHLNESNLSNFIKDNSKLEQAKYILPTLSNLESYKRGWTLEKWKYGNIVIRHVSDKIIEKQIKSNIQELNKIDGLNIVYDVNFNSNVNSEIVIETFGDRQSGADICMNCYDLTVSPITRNFKLDAYGPEITTMYLGLYGIIRSYDVTKILHEIDEVSTFTEVPSFSKYYGHMYHVNGWYFHVKHEIKYSECSIFKEHIDIIKKSLTSECILRSLGLPNRSQNINSVLSYRPTELNNIKWEEQPSNYDLLLVKLLYNKKIKPGMTRVEVMPIIKEILTNTEIPH